MGAQAEPTHPLSSAAGSALQELSTGEALVCVGHVDDSLARATGVVRLGLVLPKKQARRSVTRSLIRHQAREAVGRHAESWMALPRFARDLDAWVLRLRAPFDRQTYPSAASMALKAAVRSELDELWSRLAQDQRRAQA